VETAVDLAGDLAGRVRRGLESTFGGPARARVIVLLALVLALSSADTATVGASATELRKALHIDNTDIGLLVSVTGAVGALASVPFGVMVDRFNRINLLVASMLLWGVTMLVSAAVSTFGALLLVRVFLGAITAVAGPAVASLIGDYFPSAERGKIYGYVLGGELIGAGIGFFVTGDVAAISWRAAFVLLAIPAFALAWQVRRLPEPARGGASRLMPGATVFVDRQHARRGSDTIIDQPPPGGDGPETTDAQRTAQQRGIKPDPNLILRTDPRKMNIVAATRYVLRVRTNVILILSSACAYFFLTGIQTFGLEFVGDQYRVNTILANLLLLVVGAGAVGGVLIGGRLGDALIRRGYISGRVLVAGVAAVATVVFFIPPLLTRSPFSALPYVTAAAFFLTAQNPPLDAARLDIMVPLLWGRAEGIRTFLRTAAQSVAPVAFGGLSDLLGNNHSSLRTTFLIMLLPLAASGLILLRGVRYYPTDVATAAASLAASENGAPPPPDAREQPPGEVLG
jgi:MFS family permease